MVSSEWLVGKQARQEVEMLIKVIKINRGREGRAWCIYLYQLYKPINFSTHKSTHQLFLNLKYKPHPINTINSNLLR